MWHEARKQERKIRGLMVDYKKRAERRREFYEKIKLDPTQFLRVYGRPVKVNLDPAIAMAAESPQSMMPWQGHEDNMIDRFDVRAHLDMLPQFKIVAPPTFSRSEENEERRSNYERYRTLVENECAGVNEEQALHQIYLDEQFGAISRGNEDEKKKLAEKKAAIGYTYEDSTPVNEEENDSDESSDTDVETADLDVTLDVDALNNEQKLLLNQCAQQFGMKDDDYISWLTKDKEEQEELRQAKLLEEEKAQFAGRKSRRERRAYKEKRLAGRKLSPPSYAARDSPKYEPYKRASSSSRSRSRSPEVVKTKVEFITSFGGESDEDGVMQGPALPPHLNKTESKQRSTSSCEKQSDRSNKHGDKYRRRRVSRSKSPPRRGNRTRYSRSRSRSRERHRPGAKYSSGSDSTYRGRSFNTESQSRSPQKPWRRRGRSKSRSRSRSSYSSRSRSRTRSRSSRSYSRSRSNSRSRSRSNSRKRSRSRSSRSKSRSVSKSPPKHSVKRYRRKSLSSGSSNSESETEKKEKRTEPPKNVVVGAIKPLGKPTSVASQLKLTPQEKLKRRMQAALNRQYKADKKAEVERNFKAEQERIDREEELRMRVLEMRRRERERRHREMEERGSSSSDSDSSESRSPSPPVRRDRTNSPHRRERTVVSSRRERSSPPMKRDRSPQSRRDRSSPVGRRERSPPDYRSRHRRYRRSRSRSRSKSPDGRRLVNY